MAKKIAFVMMPIRKSLNEIGIASVAFTKQLSDHVELDLKTEVVQMDTNKIKAIAQKNMAGHLIAPFISACNDTVNGGMAVFGSEEDIKKGIAIAIP